VNWGNFFAELKRRNVYKIAVTYAVVAWLLIQVATQVFLNKEAISLTTEWERVTATVDAP
jgi:hypothetical protein